MHPLVKQAARLIMDAGWRVTSIVRPDTPHLRGPSHARGIALDIAPMQGGSGGFGPKTANLILTYLTSCIPGSRWLVVGENDHFHIQLTPTKSRVGVYTPKGVFWY